MSLRIELEMGRGVVGRVWWSVVIVGGGLVGSWLFLGALTGSWK